MPVSWLALIIGNSRLHWAWFAGARLRHVWHLAHPSAASIAALIQQRLDWRNWPGIPDSVRAEVPSGLPLWIASVVPTQTALWQAYPNAHLLQVSDIPLRQVYATLGLDRALCVWGAAHHWGLPALVIDAGTALTLTGADENARLVGGAILPGLSLQLQSLAQKTAGLPALTLPTDLPTQWATDTPTAMYSGILHSVLAGLNEFSQDWEQRYPNSPIVLTGGDGTLLMRGLAHKFPHLAPRIRHEPHLAFWGMRSVVQLRLGKSPESTPDFDQPEKGAAPNKTFPNEF